MGTLGDKFRIHSPTNGQVTNAPRTAERHGGSRQMGAEPVSRRPSSSPTAAPMQRNAFPAASARPPSSGDSGYSSARSSFSDWQPPPALPPKPLAYQAPTAFAAPLPPGPFRFDQHPPELPSKPIAYATLPGAGWTAGPVPPRQNWNGPAAAGPHADHADPVQSNQAAATAAYVPSHASSPAGPRPDLDSFRAGVLSRQGRAAIKSDLRGMLRGGVTVRPEVKEALGPIGKLFRRSRKPEASTPGEPTHVGSAASALPEARPHEASLRGSRMTETDIDRVLSQMPATMTPYAKLELAKNLRNAPSTPDGRINRALVDRIIADARAREERPRGLLERLFKPTGSGTTERLGNH